MTTSRQQEQAQDERDPLFVARFAYEVPFLVHGSSAVTLGGIGWMRSMTPALASCHTLKTLRGETFSSAFVSVWNCLVERIDHLRRSRSA